MTYIHNRSVEPVDSRGMPSTFTRPWRGLQYIDRCMQAITPVLQGGLVWPRETSRGAYRGCFAQLSICMVIKVVIMITASRCEVFKKSCMACVKLVIAGRLYCKR